MEYLDEIGWDIYIRMEYLTSFMDYCTGKELTEKEVMKLGCDLSMALIYCRKLNIIHRDIKPENIFVSRFGDFKLGDFGIAREQAHTVGNMSKKGTYSYMAPEIYKGEKYDSSIDIYSLGIVLYKLMNQNRLPFLSLDKQLITYRDKENALARRMAGEKMPAPSRASAAFSHIILKACAYDPQKRYRKPEDMLQDLESLRIAPVNAAKEWERSQWQLADARDIEQRHQKNYVVEEPGAEKMERTQVAEEPQIEKKPSVRKKRRRKRTPGTQRSRSHPKAFAKKTDQRQLPDRSGRHRSRREGFLHGPFPLRLWCWQHALLLAFM